MYRNRLIDTNFMITFKSTVITIAVMMIINNKDDNDDDECNENDYQEDD